MHNHFHSLRFGIPLYFFYIEIGIRCDKIEYIVFRLTYPIFPPYVPTFHQHSGKSMFCCILAKALTRDKRKAIIINADMNVPMLPVWLPEQIIQTNTSIGQVLSSVEIDTSLVASHVTVLKNYPFIGMMGYAAGENPLSYPEAAPA